MDNRGVAYTYIYIYIYMFYINMHIHIHVLLCVYIRLYIFPRPCLHAGNGHNQLSSEGAREKYQPRRTASEATGSGLCPASFIPSLWISRPWQAVDKRGRASWYIGLHSHVPISC